MDEKDRKKFPTRYHMLLDPYFGTVKTGKAICNCRNFRSQSDALVIYRALLLYSHRFLKDLEKEVRH